MSDKLAAMSGEWFRKGTEAMNKQNWDYATECFDRCVRMVPSNLMYRQTKRGCTRKKYDDNGSGAKMASVKLVGIRGKIKKARIQQKWEEVDKFAEEGLIINPWDSPLNADLGAACAAQGYGEIAVWSYGEALKGGKDSVEYNRALGDLHRERREFGEAIKYFDKLYKLDPHNGEVRSILGQLQAESVMKGGGYEEAEEAKDVQVNAYEADRRARKEKSQPDAADGPGASEEADLQRAIRKEPSEINNYLKLGDLYRKQKKLDKAAEQYEKAVEVSKGDENIREQLEDVQLDQLREKLSKAKEKLQRKPEDEERQEVVKKLGGELRKSKVQVLTSRIARYPNDMRLKLELAEGLKDLRQFPKAIPLLQQAAADSRLKEKALVSLGDCFRRVKKLDLARRQFEKALSGLNPQDDPELFKTAHYWLGRIYEKAGNNEKAEHHYNEILAVDYDFKDVLSRLEEIQGDDDFLDDDEL